MVPDSKSSGHKQHLDTLGHELRAYLDEKPYDVIAEKHGDFWQTVARVRLEPPRRLATVIGDCVTNARSVLDYIAYELAVRYLLPAFSVDNDRWVSFPLIGPSNAGHAGYVRKIDGFTNRHLPQTRSWKSKPFNLTAVGMSRCGGSMNS